MTDIEWACKWVGWNEYVGGRIGRPPITEEEKDEGKWIIASLNDLAEAVRVKVWEVHGTGPDNPFTGEVDALGRLLMGRGPAAFIAAVREIVDGQ